MQDDKHWLLHPVLPRPPALPKLGPELWALIGLDASDFEQVTSSTPRREMAEVASRRDTQPEALASASGVHVRVPAVRTGT